LPFQPGFPKVVNRLILGRLRHLDQGRLVRIPDDGYDIPEVRRAYGLAFYQPGEPGSVKANVCLWKDEDSIYGDVSLLDGADDLYVGELFSPTYLGRSWLDLRGPGGLRLTVSWENFSSAVVAGQWVLNDAEDSAYGSVKGQQLSFNNTCN
jgi:hypothetical protein